MGRRELKIHSLSSEEKNYIFGLFFTDGYSCIHKLGVKKSSLAYDVWFYFDSDKEQELAFRLADLLKKSGLNPHVWKDAHRRMMNVHTSSKSLLHFLPDKEVLRDDNMLRERFSKENSLLNLEGGLPFVAGLLDGDGYCMVRVARGRRYFGEVHRWVWVFSQYKYLFLADYFKRFVDSLAPGSTRTYRQANGVVNIRVLKSGITALLNAGIAKYSWKVAQWLRRANEAKIERRSYYNPGEVARALGISYISVWRRLKAGKIKYRRGIVARKGKPHSLSIHYISAEEVERLRRLVDREREIMKRVKEEGGMRLVDLAKTLGLARQTLHKQYQHGKLRATMVREGGHRYLLVPRDEAENLQKSEEKVEH
nr:hypothetical protein [Candidatus Njordarchaeota archaeon]